MSPLCIGPVTLSKKNISWFSTIGSWQIHVGYYLSLYYPLGAYKLCNHFFLVSFQVLMLGWQVYNSPGPFCSLFKDRYDICPSPALRPHPSHELSKLITNFTSVGWVDPKLPTRELQNFAVRNGNFYRASCPEPDHFRFFLCCINFHVKGLVIGSVTISLSTDQHPHKEQDHRKGVDQKHCF